MTKLAMAKPGTGFFGDGVNISWPFGRPASDVIELEEDQQKWPFRVLQRFLNGGIVKAPDDAEISAQAPAFPPSRVMVGGSPEAIAHMAIPAPQIIVARAFSPAGPEAEALVAAAPAGPTVKQLRVLAKELGIPQVGNKAELEAAVAAAQAEQAAEASVSAEPGQSGQEPDDAVVGDGGAPATAPEGE